MTATRSGSGRVLWRGRSPSGGRPEGAARGRCPDGKGPAAALRLPGNDAVKTECARRRFAICGGRADIFAGEAISFHALGCRAVPRCRERTTATT